MYLESAIPSVPSTPDRGFPFPAHSAVLLAWDPTNARAMWRVCMEETTHPTIVFDPRDVSPDAAIESWHDAVGNTYRIAIDQDD